MEVVRKIQLTVMKVPDVGGIPGTGLSTTAAGAPCLHIHGETCVCQARQSKARRHSRYVINKALFKVHTVLNTVYTVQAGSIPGLSWDRLRSHWRATT